MPVALALMLTLHCKITSKHLVVVEVVVSVVTAHGAPQGCMTPAVTQAGKPPSSMAETCPPCPPLHLTHSACPNPM